MKDFSRLILNNKQFQKYSPRQVAIGAVALIAVLVLGFYFWPSGEFSGPDFVVSSGDLSQTVSVTGTVKPISEVDLAFENSGKVAQVNFDVGDHVLVGQTIVSLNLSSLLSDLGIAKANLGLAMADDKNDKASLEEVKKQQNTLVESAYRKLLSSDLSAVPSSDSYTMSTPVISGSYNGETEGQYKLIIDSENISDYVLRTFNLEKTDSIDISETEPTALGTKGLFVSFSDDLINYINTIWYVSIPNIKGASYVSNLNSYQEALRNRDKEIVEAEKSLVGNGESTISDLEIEKKRAEIRKIEADIAKKILVAPFSGVVTRQDAKVGQIASAGEKLVSLISDNNFEIEANMPEINVGNVLIGNVVEITFDALPNEVFSGKISYIEPGETLIDGVVNYKIKVEIDGEDQRLKSGMTANLVIATNLKEGVVFVPESTLFFEGDKIFVYKKSGSSIIKTEVITGLRGDDGSVEVLSGLSEGDTIKSL